MKLSKILYTFVLILISIYLAIGIIFNEIVFENEFTFNDDAPRVMEAYFDPQLMDYWIPGFLSFKQISGSRLKPGAVYELQILDNREILHFDLMITRYTPGEMVTVNFATELYDAEKSIYFIQESDSTTMHSKTRIYVHNLLLRPFYFFWQKDFKKYEKEWMTDFKFSKNKYYH